MHLVLGMAYKRDIDDLSESPSLTVIELLQKRGANVAYNDPFFASVGRGRHYELNMASTPLDHIHRFDCAVHPYGSYSIRLRVDCPACAVGCRYPQCHQGDSGRQRRAWLMHSRVASATIGSRLRTGRRTSSARRTCDSFRQLVSNP